MGTYLGLLNGSISSTLSGLMYSLPDAAGVCPLCNAVMINIAKNRIKELIPVVSQIFSYLCT